jgi:hypothetical protein
LQLLMMMMTVINFIHHTVKEISYENWLVARKIARSC